MGAVIVDYGSGNLRSAEKALQRAAAECGYGKDVSVTADPETVRRADHILLPGVGAFGDCRRGLDAIPGMVETLEEAALKRAQPFLGVCVGMQLLADRGLEHGETAGLGWIGGVVDQIRPDDEQLRIPHMGWNRLVPADASAGHLLFADIDAGSHVYFVHSFAYQDLRREHVMATTPYGGPVVAAVERDNLFGVQFHPEKSQTTGLAILRAFLNWRP